MSFSYIAIVLHAWIALLIIIEHSELTQLTIHIGS